jgi:ribosome biogenesis protein UTP30
MAKKHKSFESRRQLFAEYDVFLADQRIVHLIPAALGSVFYKSTTKRPIPVSLVGKTRSRTREKRDALQRLKPKKKGSAENGPEAIGAPEDVGADIEKALRTLAVHLSPSATMSIKVAYAGWPAEWISENVGEVVQRVVSKYVPQQWSGVKSIHIKGPETAALPIWMAKELWLDEADVLGEDQKETGLNVTKKTKEEKEEQRENHKRKREARLAELPFDKDDVPLTQIEKKRRKSTDAEKEQEDRTAVVKVNDKGNKANKRKSAEASEQREAKRSKKPKPEPQQVPTATGKRKEKSKRPKEASRSDAVANPESRASKEEST